MLFLRFYWADELADRKEKEANMDFHYKVQQMDAKQTYKNMMGIDDVDWDYD